MRKYKYIAAILMIISVLFSCEQERLTPILTTEEGGGTLSDYIAYTINSEDPTATNVYGRVVFYKTDLDQTLVQVALYNTIEEVIYPSLFLDGISGTTDAATLMSLDNVDGSTGEFAENKFFVISDTSFYDMLEGNGDDTTASYDAHINIYDLDGTTILASGDIGVNADPVDSN